MTVTTFVEIILSYDTALKKWAAEQFKMPAYDNKHWITPQMSLLIYYQTILMDYWNEIFSCKTGWPKKSNKIQV